MTYINFDRMAEIDTKAFQHQRPFPWVNPQGFLTESGFQELLSAMPDLDLFTSFFDKQRKYGQSSHNRYVLEYDDNVPLPDPWRGFIEELKSREYRTFVERLLGRRHVRVRFHWHYTPNGCSVSPHCDSRGKLGSQIFYMNSADEWDPAWGGETVILDDHGRFDEESSPRFEDFDSAVAAETMNNRSLIFGRRGNSWHGVRQISCPEGALRKVFIVVFQDVNPRKMLYKKVKRLLSGRSLVTEQERAMY